MEACLIAPPALAGDNRESQPRNEVELGVNIIYRVSGDIRRVSVRNARIDETGQNLGIVKMLEDFVRRDYVDIRVVRDRVLDIGKALGGLGVADGE